MRIGHNVSGLFESFNAKKLWQSFLERMPVLLVIQQITVAEPPFGVGRAYG